MSLQRNLQLLGEHQQLRCTCLRTPNPGTEERLCSERRKDKSKAFEGDDSGYKASVDMKMVEECEIEAVAR